VVTFWGWRDGPEGAEPDQSVATLSGIDQVVWDRDHDMPRNVGERLGKGCVRIDSGQVAITFRTGAIVNLQGPAVFGVVSPMKGFLDYGGVEVYAPEEASDFVVSTPAMDVVDLGTRFALHIEHSTGNGQVEVQEGRVDLHLNKAERKTQIRPLLEGQSAAVDSLGNILGIEGERGDAAFARSGAPLLAHWKLEESGNSSTIRDATDNRLHGKLTEGNGSRGAEEASISGRTGRALSLNGTRFVDLSPHIEVLGGLKTYTITAWVRDPENMIFAISRGAAIVFSSSDIKTCCFMDGRTAGRGTPSTPWSTDGSRVAGITSP
jgi:hypothetical protein